MEDLLSRAKEVTPGCIISCIQKLVDKNTVAKEEVDLEQVLVLSTMALGAYLFFTYVFGLFIWIYRCALAPSTQIGQRYRKGTWAAITGSSDGIGAEFAIQCAREGFNIVLFGRSEDKLSGVKAKIHSLGNGVMVKTVICDFSGNNTKEFYDKLWKTELEVLDISIFINNAGVMYIGAIETCDVDKLTQMLDVNVVPLVMLTKKFLLKVKNSTDKTRRYALI
jgi:hypothetical protein